MAESTHSNNDNNNDHWDTRQFVPSILTEEEWQEFGKHHLELIPQFAAYIAIAAVPEQRSGDLS